MADERQNKTEIFKVDSLSDFLKQAKSTRRDFTVTARPLRDATSGDLVWLFVLATYKLGAEGYQESYGYAWTTEADGTTPKKVESLSIQIEVAGELAPPEPLSFSNVSKIGTGTRGVYQNTPQRVTAYAVSEGPHLEASDTSDD
jgi:hypothetical protein